jgi:uroporphyrin-III C-methyltransferase
MAATALRDVAVAAIERRLAEADPAGRPVVGGAVTLVGGGPGDPGLLTRRGYERLLAADVVVVDRLAPLAALADLADNVEVIDVSKVPRGRFTPQERINDILIEQARAGRAVVRLKGGDSFVFGRGMEEALACAAAGVAVEVVPGVTSAVSVPALAGIPVTHRGLAQGFSVVSGHLPPDHPQSELDWGALAHSGTTLVILMGVHTIAAVSGELLAQGIAADTPTAAIADGGLASQRVVRSTLADAAGDFAAAAVVPPAVIVIGDVVGLVADDKVIP